MFYRITKTIYLKMIIKYIDDFKKFGKVEIIDVKPDKGSKGGRPKRIIYLNESQFKLLSMYKSNTKDNRLSKIDLVNELID